MRIATPSHGLPVRWQEFDRSRTVGLTVQAGGQPGMPGGGLPQVRNAIRAWNEARGSRVNLAVDGVSRRTFPATVRDGVNSITFEDPFNEIPGSFAPLFGGTLAAAWVKEQCSPGMKPHSIPGGGSRQAMPIIEADITTQDGYWTSLVHSADALRNFEELMAHELGHLIGIDHTCRQGFCTTRATHEAIMRPFAHSDGRGAALSSDDLDAARSLYPVPPSDSTLRPPTDVRVVPTSSTSVRVTWRDRSSNEEGFLVWGRAEGGGWQVAARTPANVEEAWIEGLRPGGRYYGLVRAFRGDLYADSAQVQVSMPSDPSTPGTLQGDQFVLDFTARTTDSEIFGKSAGWSSDKGVLLSLFDSDNPEALVKVLDGRSVNGHWWLDLAVTSDLTAISRVTHRVAGDEWLVLTGLARNIFRDPGEAATHLVHCAVPASRTDNLCAISGYGTTVSLRDAWDSYGRIPSKYFAASSAATAADHVNAESPDGLFRRAAGSSAAANPSGLQHVISPLLTFTAAASTLQHSRFRVNFGAEANGSTIVGRSAGWSSDKGVLYSLFDSDNPEALVKVLDGRSVNGHWWLDLAVTSDLHTATRVTHRDTGDEWVAITGLGKDVFIDPGAAANRLVHCAFPKSRTDNFCTLSGYGTTVSLRDAWDSAGRIPSSHFD